MNIGIVGAGAIGGWLAIKLAQSGAAVSVLARGATLAALQEGPWRMTTADGELQARVAAAADPAQLGVQDVVLICLKGPALAAVAPTLSPMIGPDTMIVPMMNGVPWWFLLGGAGQADPTPLASVDPTGEIARALPFAQVIGSVVHASVAVGKPGHIVHKAGARLTFGEPSGPLTPRLEAFGQVFLTAGFDVLLTPKIRYEIWYKLWGNMTMNPISAITGATCDRVLDDPLVNQLVLSIMAEAKAIGDLIDCSIQERGEARNAVTRQLGAFKTSMLQDAEAGRPLEIDQLLGAPLEIARLVGAPAPNLEALMGLARLYASSHGLYRN